MITQYKEKMYDYLAVLNLKARSLSLNLAGHDFVFLLKKDYITNNIHYGTRKLRTPVEFLKTERKI